MQIYWSSINFKVTDEDDNEDNGDGDDDDDNDNGDDEWWWWLMNCMVIIKMIMTKMNICNCRLSIMTALLWLLTILKNKKNDCNSIGSDFYIQGYFEVWLNHLIVQ